LSAKQLVWLFFGFSGRISRLVYLLTSLLTMVVVMFLLYRLSLEENSTELSFWNIAFTIAMFVALWTQAALGAKRIQDFGKSGLFAALLFVPLVNIVGFFVLCLYPGDPGPNAYGRTTDSPK